MSKLGIDPYISKVQPDVIQLLHDEVVSLCQQKYSSVSGIEIDGIICISLLDTKEEQVVKIHKTLKSVFSKVASEKSELTRPDSYPQISAILSSGQVVREKDKDEAEIGEPHDFQTDINTLSELLKASNEANKQEELAANAGETSKKSKRKRRDPRHRTDKPDECGTKQCDSSNNAIAKNSGVSDGGQYDIYIDNVVSLKEESMDPGCVAASGTDKSKSNSTSAATGVADSGSASISKRVGSTNKGEIHAGDKVSTLIEKLIDKEIQSDVNPDIREEPEDECVEAPDFSADDVVVKVEKLDDDDRSYEELEQNLFFPNDSNVAQATEVTHNTDSNSSSDIGSGTVRTAGRNKKTSDTEKHWLYGIAKRASAENNSGAEPDAGSNEVAKMALLNKYHEQGSIGQEGTVWEKVRQQAVEQSWIDMVQSNVTKYQAALLRSNKNKLSSREHSHENSPQRQDDGKSSTAAVRENVVSLKALLSQKPLNQKDRAESDDADSGRESRSKSLPQSMKQAIAGRSRSLSPVVKIEVDEESEQGCAKGGSDSNSDLLAAEATVDNQKQPQGKLESRYPALFNQLQQAKQSSSSLDQPDSLVNRLPFISFQELFSQANPGTWTPRMSDTATMQLLAKAKVNPYPSKTSNSGKKKSVWRWKKRQVRSKDNMEEVAVPAEEDQDLSSSQRSPDMGLSPRRSFSRKRQRVDKDFESRRIDVELRKESLVSESKEESCPSTRRRTRLSAGEKPRISFAEIENSEEEEEMEEEAEVEIINEPPKSEEESPIELVSAYCQNNCGMKFATFGELQAHEMECFAGGGGSSGVVSDSAGVVSDGAGVVSDSAVVLSDDAVSPAPVTVGNSTEFKCNICGLEFNQQYRWQYHMIKVHGVTVDKTMFR